MTTYNEWWQDALEQDSIFVLRRALEVAQERNEALRERIKELEIECQTLGLELDEALEARG